MMTKLSPDTRPRDMPPIWPKTTPQPQPGAPTRVSGRYLITLVALFALLNAMDLLSTFVGLRHGLHEGNPLMSGLLDRFGFGALIAYKAVVVWAVGLGIRLLHTFHLGLAWATIWICNALVFGVVVLNVTQYLSVVQ